MGVSGTLLQCHGEVTLQLTISSGVAYNGNFAIISDVSYDAILGFPALRELGFTLLSDDPTRVILSECHTPRQQSSISVICDHFKPTDSCSRSTLNFFETYPKGRISLTNSFQYTGHKQQDLSNASPTVKSYVLACLTSKDSDLEDENGKWRQSSKTQDGRSKVQEGDLATDDWRANRVRAKSRSGTDPELATSEKLTESFLIQPVDTSLDTDERLSRPSDFDIPKMLSKTSLSESEERKLKTLLQKYERLFSVNEDDIGLFVSQDGGPSKVNFEVIDPTKVIYSVPRRLPYAQRPWLQSKLNEWCKNGLIEEVPPNKSNLTIHTSPILIVPKKNGRYRMAVDYRELNKNLKLTTFPLPNVKDCIEGLGNKKYFSPLDITSAFNQLELDDDTKRLCGFVTLGKRYITHRMPFGAHPCPSIFQQFITRALKNVDQSYCIVYLDDILVASETFTTHLEHLENVFKELLKHGFKLSPKKCAFCQETVEYLGFQVGKIGNRYGYAPLESKLIPIRELPTPTTAKEVRSFCGALQYYNSMYPRLNVKLAPLHRGAAVKEFKMTVEMIKAFEEVQKLIEEKVILAFPDLHLPFKLTTDASYAGAGAVLCQIRPDKTEEIIYLFSKSFNDTQTRWPIVELEALALVWALEKMEILLLGRRFKWYTDSLVLKHMIQNPPRDLSRSARKISRYVSFINQFDFEIIHHKGTKDEAQLADFLSRNPVCVLSNLPISTTELIEEVNKDRDLQNGLGIWKKFSNQIFYEDGILFVKRQSGCKIAIPKTLISRVISYYHETFTIHGGCNRIIPLITRLFIWPNMYSDIREAVKNCKQCLQAKPKKPSTGMKTTIETPKRPWEWIQIDLVSISARRGVDGCQYILTSVCCLTNYFMMEPIESKEAVVVLKALMKIFCLTGIPDIIQSDNGKEFKNSVLMSHAKFIKIEWRFSTPYKPNSNGRIERRHLELGKLLKLLNTDFNNWTDELPYVCFEINMTPDAITGLTPFEMFHGWSPKQPEFLSDVQIGLDEIHFDEWANDLDKMTWETQIRTRQIAMFERIHKQRHTAKELETLAEDLLPQLAPDDLVMVKDISSTGKLASKTKGPFRVLKVLKGGSVKLQNLQTNKIIQLPASHTYRYQDSAVKLDGEKGEEKEEKNEIILRRSQRQRKNVNYAE